MKRKQIQPGEKFGRWTVLFRHEKLNKSNQSVYSCKCACGKIKNVPSCRLTGGTSKSCGCLAKELTVKRATLHGMSGHRLFPSWGSMMSRCYNKNNHAYPLYGGRGITVCRRWHNVKNFIKDNEKKSIGSLSLDRINNDLGYFPKNTKWSTKQEQSLNRRSNRVISFNGVEKPLFKWAYDIGMPPKTLWSRLKNGWSFEKAISTPLRKY